MDGQQRGEELGEHEAASLGGGPLVWLQGAMFGRVDGR